MSFRFGLSLFPCLVQREGMPFKKKFRERKHIKKTCNADLSSYSMFLQNGDDNKFRYGGWWSVWWTGTYSMVLSKAAFFHKKYFALYTNEMPSSIREFVTKNRFLSELYIHQIPLFLSDFNLSNFNPTILLFSQ
jgi:hypothetical protein